MAASQKYLWLFWQRQTRRKLWDQQISYRSWAAPAGGWDPDWRGSTRDGGLSRIFWRISNSGRDPVGWAYQMGNAVERALLARNKRRRVGTGNSLPHGRWFARWDAGIGSAYRAWPQKWDWQHLRVPVLQMWGQLHPPLWTAGLQVKEDMGAENQYTCPEKRNSGLWPGLCSKNFRRWSRPFERVLIYSGCWNQFLSISACGAWIGSNGSGYSQWQV